MGVERGPGAWTLILAFITICNSLGCKHHATTDQEFKAVYGQDERLEYYQLAEPYLLGAAEATALVLEKSLVSKPDKDDFIRLMGSPLKTRRNFCASEPYLDQPSVGHCSAFLAAEDIVVTANHCLGGTKTCENIAFVFDYAYRKSNDDPALVPNKNVFYCREIMASEYDAKGPGLDYLVIRLDRKVTDRRPMKIAKNYEVKIGDTLLMLGHPLGLPLKIATSGRVRTTDNPAFFKTTLDSFFGNSGSPVVLPEDGSVVGILVRGETDFTTRENGCLATNMCAEDSCYGEDVVRASRFADVITRDAQKQSPGASAVTGCWHTSGAWGWDGQNPCQNFPPHCNGGPSWCTLP